MSETMTMSWSLVKGRRRPPQYTGCPTSSVPTLSLTATATSYCPPSDTDTLVLVTVNNLLSISCQMSKAEESSILKRLIAVYKIKCIKKFLAAIKFANNKAVIEFL